MRTRASGQPFYRLYIMQVGCTYLRMDVTKPGFVEVIIYQLSAYDLIDSERGGDLMNPSVRLFRRRLKQCVAGLLFVGLLIGASGTVFTVFAVAISQLGNSPNRSSVVRVVTGQSGSSGQLTRSTNPEQSQPNAQSQFANGYQPPVMEYSNTQSATPARTSSTSVAADGVNSQLADAMQQGGVYIGQKVQSTFGSMLKGVLNALFINTN